MRIIVVVLLLLTAPMPARAETINDYGQRCEALIAPIPTFNCADGVEIPVTVNGSVPASFQPGMTCDRPALFVPPEKGVDGQCVPYSRLLILRDDAKAQISAICRQKKIRPANTMLYDEIDIVAHDLPSGSTCWFQALASDPLSPGTGLNGKAVPPPTSASAPSFWNPPTKTAEGKCISCHDSDPFMYSPFVAQTGLLPQDPFGKYRNDIGPDFANWPQPLELTTRGNTCVGCHRVGSMATCQVTMGQSVGRAPMLDADDWAKRYPNSHWMPAGNTMTPRQWEVVHGSSVNELARCCANPNANGCIVRPLPRPQ
ncbi:MAG: hypothetical protein QOF19_81 [Alphaproteobacteria bacterium]|jgi:hypothetical protein|nr:hypothetical protein [Alphaproteobacteria bacterium]